MRNRATAIEKVVRTMRDVMGNFCTGVTVITAIDGEPVQVVDVGRTEMGVLLGEVAQRGHGDQGATPRLTSSR